MIIFRHLIVCAATRRLHLESAKKSYHLLYSQQYLAQDQLQTVRNGLLIPGAAPELACKKQFLRKRMSTLSLLLSSRLRFRCPFSIASNHNHTQE